MNKHLSLLFILLLFSPTNPPSRRSSSKNISKGSTLKKAKQQTTAEQNAAASAALALDIQEDENLACLAKLHNSVDSILKQAEVLLTQTSAATDALKQAKHSI